jgi:hypothetical protein
LSSVLCLAILQPTIRRSTLPVDITTDYPLYRLSAMLSLELLQLAIHADYAVPLLCLPILQPTIRSALH